MIGLASCNQLLLDNYNSPLAPSVIFLFTTRERRNTIHSCCGQECVQQNNLTHTVTWKYPLHCVRNSITTVTLTNRHGLSINSQHTSTAKPRQQEKEGDGELNAAELSQKSLHKKGIDIFIHRSIQCIRQSSAGLSHTHQWSLTEVKAKHYSHLICISKNSDNIYLYLN